MRRILLVLAMAIILLAVVAVGTALADRPMGIQAGCQGIINADVQQKLTPGNENAHSPIDEEAKACGF